MVADLEQAFREQWARVLAALIGLLGDFDLAEEAAQEAFAIAATRWPRDGTPTNPGAWLLRTARNRAINRIRRDRTLAAKTRLLEVAEAVEDAVDETNGIAGIDSLAEKGGRRPRRARRITMLSAGGAGSGGGRPRCRRSGSRRA